MKTFILIFWCAIIGSIYYIYKEETKLNHYIEQHHYVEISRHSNPSILIMMPILSGKVTILVPQWVPQDDTITYKCDNGKFIR